MASAAEDGDSDSDRDISVFFGLVPREDVSQEEFEEYYFESHVPTAKAALGELPVLPLTYEAVVPATPDESPYGAVAWLTFTSQSEVEDVFATEQWERAAGDLENFTQADRNLVFVGSHHDNLSTTT